ncbi:hypothetical protein AAX08_09050 [Moraxella bovoculi]|nr:hypothetical protein [Moraxella bovoculi]AKG16005.1 hypothetical protein AAX08_09050 [Moraxella bovoculi]
MQKWKQVSYKKNAGLNDVQIQDWESSVNQIYKHYIGYCKNTDASCNAILDILQNYPIHPNTSFTLSSNLANDLQWVVENILKALNLAKICSTLPRVLDNNAL